MPKKFWVLTTKNVKDHFAHGVSGLPLKSGLDRGVPGLEW